VVAIGIGLGVLVALALLGEIAGRALFFGSPYPRPGKARAQSPVLLGDLPPLLDTVWEPVRAMPFRIVTNSAGFRKEREVAPDKPAGTLRVVCLGDSFTFGTYLPNHDTFPELLEARLIAGGHAVEVINAGKTGYTICCEYSWLLDRGPLARPDMIVLELLALNLFGMSEHLKWDYCRGGPECVRAEFPASSAKARAKNLLRRSVLAKSGLAVLALQAFKFARRAFQPASGEPIDQEQEKGTFKRYLRGEDPVRAEHEARYAAIFAKFAARCRDEGIALVAFLVPERSSPSVTGFYERICRENGVTYLDLNERLAAYPEEATQLRPLDYHLSRQGNALVAEALAPLVAARIAAGTGSV
jgi:lysophospholipase L1-like esterase